MENTDILFKIIEDDKAIMDNLKTIIKLLLKENERLKKQINIHS